MVEKHSLFTNTGQLCTKHTGRVKKPKGGKDFLHTHHVHSWHSTTAQAPGLFQILTCLSYATCIPDTRWRLKSSTCGWLHTPLNMALLIILHMKDTSMSRQNALNDYECWLWRQLEMLQMQTSRLKVWLFCFELFMSSTILSGWGSLASINEYFWQAMGNPVCRYHIAFLTTSYLESQVTHHRQFPNARSKPPHIYCSMQCSCILNPVYHLTLISKEYEKGMFHPHTYSYLAIIWRGLADLVYNLMYCEIWPCMVHMTHHMICIRF